MEHSDLFVLVTIGLLIAGVAIAWCRDAANERDYYKREVERQVKFRESVETQTEIVAELIRAGWTPFDTGDKRIHDWYFCAPDEPGYKRGLLNAATRQEEMEKLKNLNLPAKRTPELALVKPAVIFHGTQNDNCKHCRQEYQNRPLLMMPDGPEMTIPSGSQQTLQAAYNRSRNGNTQEAIERLHQFHSGLHDLMAEKTPSDNVTSIDDYRAHQWMDKEN